MSDVVGTECLKLTTYFGERQRTGGKFLADALLDLCGEREIATSVLLRGIGGFGLRHTLRTDQTLSLSEDPPVVAVAVDAAHKIDGLLGAVRGLEWRGLLTLERARLVRDRLDPFTESPNEATKLTIYVGRREQVYRVPAYIAVCELLHRRGILGASVFLGVDGTVHGRRARARFFDRNVDVPLMIIAVGAGDQIARVVSELGGLLQRPLVTLERVRVCTLDGERFEQPQVLPAVDDHGLGIWQKIMVHTTESATYQGEPIHRALIRRLRSSGYTRGATALRGIWGFRGGDQPHGDRLLQLTRQVPVNTVIVDTPANIARSFDIIDEVTSEHGLVTSEMVPALLSLNEDKTRGGTRLAHHHWLGGGD